ncbi:MAG: DUF2062 domain-containing protein [Alcanivorax sp.]|nr:DUF2062 domain-containing protein [Alcanivorax sp.]
MPRKLFRKYLPTAERLRQHRSLGSMSQLFADPNLWHLNRRSLSGAAFIGIFSAFMPIPLQMLLAAGLALRFKCNLPMSIVLVWISNPLTYVPIFYFTYRVGAGMLGMSRAIPEQVTIAWFVEQLIPLWVGSLVCGLVFGGLAFVIVRLLWRLAIVRSWKRRNQPLP